MAFSFWHCRFGREVWGVLQLARNWRTHSRFPRFA